MSTSRAARLAQSYYPQGQTQTLVVRPDTDVQDWYMSSTRPDELLKTAFHEAVQQFNTSLTKDTKKKRLAQKFSSFEEIQSLVEQLQQSYDTTGSARNKIQKWLERLSSHVLRYEKVLDTFAQINPEYAGLAWGVIKFVLVGIKGHGDLITEFSTILCQISDVLPRHMVTATLFPTPRMKESLSQLYAYLIKVLLQTVKWYETSPAGRFLYSLRKPFELNLKTTLEGLSKISDGIDRLASTASMVEIRDIHLAVGELCRRMSAIGNKVDTFAVEMDQLQNLHRGLQTIYQRISLSSSLLPNTVPDSDVLQVEEILNRDQRSDRFYAMQLSFARRRQVWERFNTDPSKFLRSMAQWLYAPKSSLHIMKSSVRAAHKTKDLAVQTVDILISLQYIVFWYLSSDSRKDTIQAVARTLFLQALRTAPEIYRSTTPRFSKDNFSDVLTEDVWLGLLSQSLNYLRDKRTFIVVESGSTDGHLETFFQNLFKSCQDSKVKIFLLLSSVGRSGTPPESLSGVTASYVEDDLPIASRNRRRAQHRTHNVLDSYRAMLSDISLSVG